ncbi:hypothetical protein HDC90_001153 [Pedobacter sp. AK013]|uniref:hypothetical protein n=1 Tax=Pedobacter sp. AK013 TaxID=2723071 RepID=UPI001617771C|nr:hypothetical protein [Pedobacter sp. AK013]MBB6236541.1 hypothetical protein [Pedobacter sp. AK013]
MKILTTDKRKSWVDRLKEMKAGGTMPVSLECADAVRQAISRKLAYTEEGMSFTTKVMKDGKGKRFLEVTCLNDGSEQLETAAV